MSFWDIFKCFNIQNIFNEEKPVAKSNVNLKKDDDYEIKHHLRVMEEIDKYKKYDLQSLSDSEIRIIAEDIYSLAKESGEIYCETDIFCEELREMKRVVLLADERIRDVLQDLIRNTEDLWMFRGLQNLEGFVWLADDQTTLRSLDSIKKAFGDMYF